MRSIKLTNFLILESSIGAELTFLDLGEAFYVVNIYGPYEDRVVF
jgi:hypothetical protein